MTITTPAKNLVLCEIILQKRKRKKKTFSDKPKLRKSVTRRSALEEVTKEVLQREGK